MGSHAHMEMMLFVVSADCWLYWPRTSDLAVLDINFHRKLEQIQGPLELLHPYLYPAYPSLEA